MSKRYLGDGCYVDYDGYSLHLTTEDGIRVTNRVVLEPEVYGALLVYVQSLSAALNAHPSNVGQAGEDAAEGDPHGGSGPRA